MTTIILQNRENCQSYEYLDMFLLSCACIMILTTLDCGDGKSEKKLDFENYDRRSHL